VPTETSNGTITNGTGFESSVGRPGFCTCTLIVPFVCTSDGLIDVVQAVVDAHVVLRDAPFNRIAEAELPLPTTKFTPSTSSGNDSTAPAITLEGKIVSIAGPLVMASVADADFVESTWLVAITEIALGDGATEGAV